MPPPWSPAFPKLPLSRDHAIGTSAIVMVMPEMLTVAAESDRKDPKVWGAADRAATYCEGTRPAH
jgi:hypothetical protein